MDITFDVVIPTTRLVPERLVQLLRVHESVPQAKVSYYIVVDLPGADLHALEALVQDRADVTLLRNETWLGAHGTRNRGIDAGKSELIVLLDDDVVPSPGLLAAYIAAIIAAPTSPGYVGVTRFPAAHDHFTQGIVASDILTFFDLAEKQPHMPWGVTANLCLRRSALGDVRFSNAFPKAGGGEDIDLCLRLARRGGRGGQAFVSVPEAWVEHPWWTDGRGSYRRFFRWAFGDSRLPALHPQHRYWNAPMLPEALLLLIIAWMLGPPISLSVGAAVLLALVGTELVVDYGKLWCRGRRVSLRVALESTIIRLTNDLGRLMGNFSRGRLWGLFERFDYFCDRVHVAGERRVAVTKLVGWLVAVTLIAWFAR
jgi:GT2 family glycosyltransferase